MLQASSGGLRAKGKQSSCYLSVDTCTRADWQQMLPTVAVLPQSAVPKHRGAGVLLTPGGAKVFPQRSLNRSGGEGRRCSLLRESI